MKAGAKKQAATPSVVQMLKVERAIESVTPPLWCPMETTEVCRGITKIYFDHDFYEV